MTGTKKKVLGKKIKSLQAAASLARCRGHVENV